MVDIADRQIGFDLIHTHRLQLQIGHGSCGILCQCLINADCDGFSSLHHPFYQMLLYDFLGYCWHNFPSFLVYMEYYIMKNENISLNL